MNRQQLYTLSGVLLASTALAGWAQAGTVGHETGVGATGFSTSALKIANTIFSTTATTADAVTVGGGAGFILKFSNIFTANTKFSVEIDVAGANFITGNIGETDVIVVDANGSAGASFYAVQTTGNTCSSTTPLVSKIIIDGCQLSGFAGTSGLSSGTTGSNVNHSVAAGGILLSGVTFNTANALATVGNTIALSGSVYNTTNPTQSFETITSASIVTAAAPLSAKVTACNNVTADPTATPAAFDYLSNTNLSAMSMCLATVTITGTGALDQTLSTPVDITTAASSITVTVTDTVLGSAAIADVNISGTTVSGNATVANFAGGSATFSIATTLAASSNFTIQLGFTGSTPIPAAASGTVSVAFGSGSTNGVIAAATVSGATAQINRGGFNAELNTFLASSNTSFTSFARLHNMGATSGTATITVLNDATGAQLGSAFTTATVASGQTLQLSNKDIETAAGITAASGVNYTIQITGPFIGYAQHIIFNPATGQLADLSGFRNHDAGSGSAP